MKIKRCTDCIHYGVTDDNKEEQSCNADPANITNMGCLIRRLLWAVYCLEETIQQQTEVMVEEAEDDDETWPPT